MGAAITGWTRTAEFGQQAFGVAVIDDVWLIGGRRVESALEPQQVFLAELDRIWCRPGLLRCGGSRIVLPGPG